ncbi:hypothetical protein SAMD00019534_071290, partial [Acytostelium subglobosum LB1]|uniref:hypothetical protein n=1 Tax=Acytostelium subglobosum LB1 TaxID=1410327 RepID=UPI000644ABD8
DTTTITTTKMSDIGWERMMTAVIAFTTNLSCIPLGYECIRRGHAYEAVIGAACAISSMMYHVGEIYEKTAWFQMSGLNADKWHRLDNIFTILSFQAMMFYLMEYNHPQIVDLLRWVFLVFTLYCQMRDPWNLLFTILPILLSVFLLVCTHIYKRRVPEWLKTRHFMYGVGTLLVAAFFFARGLDDENDYLRINHGIWHLLVGFAFWFIFQSRSKHLKSHLHVSRRHRVGESSPSYK